MEEGMGTNHKAGRRRALGVLLGAMSLATGCGASKAPEPPPACGRDCQDNIALRALRETTRFLYNRHLQGKPTGPQDVSAACPLGVGTIHIAGDAMSDASLGTTRVNLTYEFDKCATRAINATPERNYALLLSGTLVEHGLLVMGTGTTAVDFTADMMSFVGTVYDPEQVYNEEPPVDAGPDCAVHASQNGNNVTGDVCGRPAGFSGF
jgi:hypothetical protein